MYLVYSIPTNEFRPSEEDLPRYTKREHHSEPLSAACSIILTIVLAAFRGNKQRALWILLRLTRTVKLASGENLISFDVTSLFTYIPTSEVVETIRKHLRQDDELNKTNFPPYFTDPRLS